MSRSAAAKARRKETYDGKLVANPAKLLAFHAGRHRRRNKIAYLSEEEATIWVTGRPGFDFYRCYVCRFWHTTSRGPSNRTSCSPEALAVIARTQ